MKLFGRWQSAIIAGLAVVGVGSAVLIPVAPRMGFSMQASACEAFGACRTAQTMSDACTVDTTAAVSGQTRTPVYFEEAGGLGLRYFVDGTAAIAGDAGDGLQTRRFSSDRAALRWLVGRSQAEAKAVDRVWGPSASGPTEAILTGADSVGLGSRTESSDASDIALAEDGQTVVSAQRDGGRTAIQAVPLPSPAGGRITGLAQWLGIRGHLVLTTVYSNDGAPKSLTITGPARSGWNLRILSTSRPKAGVDRDDPPQSDRFTLRSYTLDLTQEQNSRPFNAVFTGSGSAGGQSFQTLPSTPFSELPNRDGDAGRRYATDDLADQLRTEAVVIESEYRSARSGELTPLDTLTLTAGLPRSSDGEDFSPRLASGEAIDLRRPEGKLAPFVNCDPENADDDEE